MITSVGSVKFTLKQFVLLNWDQRNLLGIFQLLCKQQHRPAMGIGAEMNGYIV